jgi:propanol-preferring alcohol dehydrogenase
MGYRVIAVDAGSQKEESCLGLGANAYVDIEQEADIPAAVRQLTDKQGARAAIVCAGSSRAYQDAFQMVAPFGTLVCVGITPLSQPIQFHPLTLIDNGIRVVGSMVGTRGDILEAVEFVKRGQVVPSVQMLSLEEIADVAKLQALKKVRYRTPLDGIGILFELS